MGDLFDKISSAVFNTDRPKFDLGLQYYTVLTNMPGTDDLYQKVKDEISNKISDNAIAYVAYEQIQTSDALEELFFQRADRWATQRRNHFVLLKTFTGDENDADEIKKVIDNIHLLSDHEKISLFLVIPFVKRECAKEINSVLKKIPVKTNVFVFTERPERYKKQILYESICGTIVMNSYFSYEEGKSARVNRAINKANIFINAMSVGGQQYYHSLPDFTWTTACCHFENTKDTFLYTYLYKLMENMIPFEQKLFNDYFETIDKEMNFGSRSTTLLRQAYEKIPRIDQDVLREEPEEIHDITQHFRRLFGDGGDHVVKTTINTTLYFNDRNASPNYDFYARKIFEKYIEYRGTSDYPNIRNIIDHYIETLSDRHADELKNLRDSRSMDEYLKGYIQIYAIKKKIDFWREIKIYIDKDISIAGTNIYELNQTSLQNMEMFHDLFGYCKVQTSPAIERMIDCPSSLSFNDIMNLFDNNKECEKISKSYYDLDIKESEVRFDMDSVFHLPVSPNLYEDEPVSLSEMNLPYSIKGIERNGKYWDCIVKEG